MRIELVSCPNCDEYGPDEQCLGCTGRGCVPVEAESEVFEDQSVECSGCGMFVDFLHAGDLCDYCVKH